MNLLLGTKKKKKRNRNKLRRDFCFTISTEYGLLYILYSKVSNSLP